MNGLMLDPVESHITLHELEFACLLGLSGFKLRQSILIDSTQPAGLYW